ncbi:MAG TPA: glycosyltransferase [Acidobacteriota bacterium]|jgi:glycosyltransferase involved in cell wall biosynthesis
MRVAQIGPAHPYRGGIAHYTVSLHRALQKRSHDSVVISFSRLYPSILFPGKSQFDESQKTLAIDHERIVDSLNPRSWRAAARRILELHPDVAVFQYWHPFFAPSYRSIVSGLAGHHIPAVFICHNVDPHELHFLARALRDTAFNKVRRFIVHSEKDRLALQQIRPRAQIITARHPAYDFFEESPLSSESARRHLGLPEDENLILFFGYVRKYKGLQTLLRSLPQVLKHERVRLLVAGEFYEPREKYDRLIRDLGLQSCVTVHGWYVPNEKVSWYFKAADLAVLPYHSATQSGIVPTAYFFDLPVVTTRVGGLPEVVLEGRTGLLVPPKDSHALADAIVRFFARGKQAEFREEIRRFKAQFSWDCIVDAIEKLAGIPNRQREMELEAQ